MQTTLNVQGMTCSHCEQSVKSTLQNLNGVNAVDVQLESGKVDIAFDDSNITMIDIRNAIEEQGYDVIF
ncbi:MAG TPA: copper chaperone CopZ [Candidatus Avamphibacillus intestinigallinarum]|nr:copper chaperone CopZ [Candidatus Avamphibacillus intestinigallinarum]